MHSTHSMSNFGEINALENEKQAFIKLLLYTRLGSRNINTQENPTISQSERETLRQILSVDYSEYSEGLKIFFQSQAFNAIKAQRGPGTVHSLSDAQVCTIVILKSKCVVTSS